jgi:hypothetical protein
MPFTISWRSKYGATLVWMMADSLQRIFLKGWVLCLQGKPINHTYYYTLPMGLYGALLCQEMTDNYPPHWHAL